MSRIIPADSSRPRSVASRSRSSICWAPAASRCATTARASASRRLLSSSGASDWDRSSASRSRDSSSTADAVASWARCSAAWARLSAALEAVLDLGQHARRLVLGALEVLLEGGDLADRPQLGALRRLLGRYADALRGVAPALAGLLLRRRRGRGVLALGALGVAGLLAGLALRSNLGRRVGLRGRGVFGLDDGHPVG